MNTFLGCDWAALAAHLRTFVSAWHAATPVSS
jgi:hypothetical protein